MDSERLRDLLMEEKRSWWPRILAIILLLAAAGAGYWFYLHPEQLNPDSLKARAKAVLDTPVMKSPIQPPAPAEPTQDDLLVPGMKKDKPK